MLKKTGSFIGRQIVRPYTRAFEAARHVATSMKEQSASVHETIEGLKKGSAIGSHDADMIAARKIADDQARFEFLIDAKNWTPGELAAQLRTVKVNQAFYIIATILGTVASGWQLGYVTAANLLIAGMFAMAAMLMGAMALKMSLFRVQIENRRLMSFSEFTDRPDFLKRLLLPF